MLAAVSGQARIVVGTHALISESVGFFDLGLVVVDEQHRFGVEQREALRRKGNTPPHVLVLTATPIPRTVAMTVFGDLDVSTIAELPRRPGADRVARGAARRASRAGRRGSGSGSPRSSRRAGRRSSCARRSTAREPEDDGEPPSTRRRRRCRSGHRAAPATVRRHRRRTPRATARCADARIEALHGRMPSDEKDAAHACLRRRARSTCSWPRR